ncbi:alpha-mannosidase D-like isoform X2 [Diabrotica virgifera virgifera]|uniref:Glycoside hydrolase family 38 N-terminal domain-containing protein n=1 Tax=Diabrotica virgifera virgifera TaxID=50390 RepID=A0ABM5KQH4_DIAVI|nr:alpha-mannosidase D-like isoform X2 [Diabrotica virgifera virgifera]
MGWQIDPFGHSKEMASIFAQVGFDGLLLGRIDYQEKDFRLSTKTAEVVWRSSQNLGKHIAESIVEESKYKKANEDPGDHETDINPECFTVSLEENEANRNENEIIENESDEEPFHADSDTDPDYIPTVSLEENEANRNENEIIENESDEEPFHADSDTDPDYIPTVSLEENEANRNENEIIENESDEEPFHADSDTDPDYIPTEDKNIPEVIIEPNKNITEATTNRKRRSRGNIERVSRKIIRDVSEWTDEKSKTSLNL